MGSRLKTDPEHLFEAFFEVAGPTDEAPEPHIVATFPEDFKDDVVSKELPRFCFPCDLSRYNPAGQLFTFVLTGIDNLQRFGFCRHPPGAKTAICFLSYLPWFDIFYKVLNKMASLKSSSEQTAKALLTELHRINVPAAGQSFRVCIDDAPNSIDLLHTCPDTKKTLPSIPENINMTEYFSAVTPENMIILFVSLLHERRVLITSNRLHRLAACVHGAVSMLYPLHWQHIYIPVTPSHLIDYCSAPMPFLIGVHSSFMEQVRRMALDEVVILDADNNSIETPFDDLQTLPYEAVTQLKHNLKNSSQVSGDGVARSFLKTIVYLLGSYKDALKLEDGQIVFDRDQFLATSPKHELPFRKMVLQLQHFTQFVESRVAALNLETSMEDLFEEELDSRSSSGSKLQDNFKRKLNQAKLKSTNLYGRVKENVRDAKDKVIQAQGNLKVPVNVNPQAVKDAFYQTKHFAGKRLNTVRDKLKPKESEDILPTRKDYPDISLPISGARSTPSSPTSSPVLSRKKPTSASAQLKDRDADKRGMRHYNTLDIDQSEELTLEEALKDDALLPARYSSMDLMPAVQPILQKLDRASPAFDDTDTASQGSSGGPSTPQPLPRKKKEKRRQDGSGDNISLGSNNSSSSSLNTQSVNSSEGQGASRLPPPPKTRPKVAPPPPPPPTYLHHQSSNNSNDVNLIDISPDSAANDGEVGQFEDNFTTFDAGSSAAADGKPNSAAPKKQTGQKLLEEYGLHFDSLTISRPPSLRSDPPGQAARASQVFTSARQEPVTRSDSAAFQDLMAPPLVTVTTTASPWAPPGPAVASSNPFSPQPAVPQPPVLPFQAPLSPAKVPATGQQPSNDPFADLVNMQRTTLSPVRKDAAGASCQGPTASH
ncbi:uncharacterized protein [Diadema setosum]|uniref:uncharacterized protein n=1 Tax=Diadema setosum TaxID=31175 RepID=UPI003B3AE81C